VSLDEIEKLLTEVDYPGMVFLVGGTLGNEYLQVIFPADGATQHGRKWRLSRAMVKSEIVQTALMAVLAANEHEVREHFLYRGVPIFGPHYDVDALLEIAGRRDVRS